MAALYQNRSSAFPNATSGHRFHNASAGRWLNRDPIGERGGFNLYGFTSNDPINTLDLLGLLECRCSEEDCNELRDITQSLNQKISADLSSAWTDAKSIGGDFLQIARDKLSQDIDHPWSKGLTRIDGWIQELGADWWKSDGGLAGGYKYASCIKLTCHGKTRCVGADKICHFMQQGFMLHQVAQKLGVTYATQFSKWTEGLLPSYTRVVPPGVIVSLPEGPLERWLQYGKCKFYGFEDQNVSSYHLKWGNVGGIPWPIRPSLPDHNVNVHGMEFWNSLANRTGGGFRFNICDYIKDLDTIVER